MYKSQKSIADQGIPKLPTESVKVSEFLSLEIQVGNTGIGVSSLLEFARSSWSPCFY